MNIDIEQFIPSGAGLLATIVSLVGMWFKFQNKVERLTETDIEQDRQIKAVWKWKEDLERDMFAVRERYNDRMSRMEGSNLVVVEQFKQIMTVLEDIKDRLEKLEDGKDYK